MQSGIGFFRPDFADDAFIVSPQHRKTDVLPDLFGIRFQIWTDQAAQHIRIPVALGQAEKFLPEDVAVFPSRIFQISEKGQGPHDLGEGLHLESAPFRQFADRMRTGALLSNLFQHMKRPFKNLYLILHTLFSFPLPPGNIQRQIFLSSAPVPGGLPDDGFSTMERQRIFSPHSPS